MLRQKFRLIMAGSALFGALASAQTVVEEKSSKDVPEFKIKNRDTLTVKERFQRLWFNLKRLPETVSEDIPFLPSAFERELALQIQESYDSVDARMLGLEHSHWDRIQPGYRPESDLFLDEDRDAAESLFKDWLEGSLSGLKKGMATEDAISDIAGLFKWEVELLGDENKKPKDPKSLPPSLAEKARRDALEDELATRYSREKGAFGRNYSAKCGIKLRPTWEGFKASIYGKLRNFKVFGVKVDELKIEQTQENGDTYLRARANKALSEKWFIETDTRIPVNGDQTFTTGINLIREKRGKSSFSIGVSGGSFPEDEGNCGSNDSYKPDVRLNIRYIRRFK